MIHVDTQKVAVCFGAMLLASHTKVQSVNKGFCEEHKCTKMSRCKGASKTVLLVVLFYAVCQVSSSNDACASEVAIRLSTAKAKQHCCDTTTGRCAN